MSKQRLNNKISPLGRFLLFDPMISLFHKPILVFGTKKQQLIQQVPSKVESLQTPVYFIILFSLSC